MEAAFRADFSDVRVHVGRDARSIGAIAFTWGSNIHFAPGQYNPDSLQGQRLLGHELAHVLQQRGGRVKNPHGSRVAVVQDAALEAEADRLGLRAAMTPAPRPRATTVSNTGNGDSVQRYTVRPPQAAQSGRYNIAATASGLRKPIGSVNVRVGQRGVAEITDLNVAAEHRRQGVGKQLMNAAIENARRLGLSTARLEARPFDGGMPGRSLISMYQRMGFRTVGISQRGVPLMERSTSSNIY
jgi:ribosomal protein S18 acetylase RimI-like enzyme